MWSDLYEKVFSINSDQWVGNVIHLIHLEHNKTNKTYNIKITHKNM